MNIPFRCEDSKNYVWYVCCMCRSSSHIYSRIDLIDAWRDSRINNFRSISVLKSRSKFNLWV